MYIYIYNMALLFYMYVSMCFSRMSPTLTSKDTSLLLVI